jgi:hypothetical protein
MCGWLIHAQYEAKYVNGAVFLNAFSTLSCLPCECMYLMCISTVS